MARKDTAKAQQQAALDESTVDTGAPKLSDGHDQILEEAPGIGPATDILSPKGDPGGLSSFGRSARLPDDLGVGDDSGFGGSSTLLDDLTGGQTGPLGDIFDDVSDGSGLSDFDDQRDWTMSGGGAGSPQDGDPPGMQGESFGGQPTGAEETLADLAEAFPGLFNYVSDYDYFVQPGADDPPPGTFVKDEDDILDSRFVWGSDYGRNDPQGGGDPEYQTEHGQSGGSASQNHTPGEIIDPWDDDDDDDDEERESQSGSSGGDDPPSEETMPAPDDGTGGEPDADDFIGGRGDVDPAPETEPAGDGGDLDTVAAGLGAVDPDPDAEEVGTAGRIDMVSLGQGVIDPLEDESTLLGNDTGDLAEMATEADLGNVEVEFDDSLVDADIGGDV